MQKQNPMRLSEADFRQALQQSSRSSPNVEYSADQILKSKLRFMAIARSVCPDFELSEEQKPIINDIFRWCMLLPGKYDSSKGLWIWGSVGSGKSTLIQVIKQFCYEVRPETALGDGRHELPYCLIVRSANDIVEEFVKSGYEGLDYFKKATRLCIDDLGTENRFVNHYGSTCNVIGQLLMYRYDRRHNCETYATSNISPPQIAAIYDERVFDRCGEMFNFVRFDGYTHRPPIEYD